MVTQDFERMIEKYNVGLDEFYKGNPEPAGRLWSERADSSLLGAFGGVSVGPKEVKKHLDTRAASFQSGRNLTIEYKVMFCEGNLGYTVGIERFEAKVGGKEGVRVAFRATTVFRREDGTWKVAHRIGDPLVYLIDPPTYQSLAKYNEQMGG